MTDEETALAAQGGNKAAEDRLLLKYTGLVKSIAARFFLCGGETEDLVQEGMVGLHAAVNTFAQGGANFSTYAYACIRNAVTDAVKKSLGSKHSALNNFVPIVEIGEEFPSPEEELLKRESRREFLQKISGALSSLEFKVTVMYLDGTGVSEMAEALEKPQKSISNALGRAKRKLGRLYALRGALDGARG